MSIAATPSVVQDIVDNADERELWIVGREFERPPYFHAGKGGDTRLARALRVCIDNRIAPNSDGTYLVEGSEHRTYRVGESCSCPQSQKANSKWCYHAVAVALYVEWQRRIRNAAPVALGTLRAGTLPLGPTTVEERLALGTIHDTTALQTHHIPQEDRMADDEYIPEPEGEEAPVAVLEASDADFPPLGQPRGEGSQGVRNQGGPPDAPPHSLTPSLPSPSLDARTLEHSMQAYAAQRAVVTRYIKEQMAEGVDYYTLTIKGRVSKATLSKAGSEKFLSLFQLSAQFQQDLATWQMLGSKDGLLCYTCTLMTRSGEVIGEGRGARSVSQDGGDINKAIKMATKSAQVDAVLRTGALSDVFTQDLEPEEGSKGEGSKERGGTATPAASLPSQTPVKPTSQDLRQRIWAMVKGQAPDMRTREQVETWIKAETGYDLHPDNYRDIIESLTVRA